MTRPRRLTGGLATLVAAVALASVSTAWACTSVNSPYLDAAEPNRGEPGTVVRISGGSWQEGSVDLQWRTASNATITNFGAVTVDSSGDFATSVTIPSSATEGTYYVGAVQADVSRATPFEVVAATSDGSGSEPSGQDAADESSDTSTDGDPNSTGDEPSGSTGDEPSGSTGDEPSSSSEPDDSNSTQTSGGSDPDGSGDNTGTASGSPDGDGSSDGDSQNSQTASGGSEPSGSQQTQDDGTGGTEPTGDTDATGSSDQQAPGTAEPDGSPAIAQPPTSTQPAERREPVGEPAAGEQTDAAGSELEQTDPEPTQQPVAAAPPVGQAQPRSDPVWRGLENLEPTPGLGELGGDKTSRSGDDPLAGLTVGAASLAIGLTLLALGFGVADLSRRRRATTGDHGRPSSG